MVAVSPGLVAILVVVTTALAISVGLSVYSTVKVNEPNPVIHLDDATQITGRLSIFLVEPDTNASGCVSSNGTHYSTGSCGGGDFGIINLANVSLFTGALPVIHGGTGATTFLPGIVKSSGSTDELFTESTINLDTEVSNVLDPIHGGLGTTGLALGFLQSPGPNLTITSLSAINLVNNVTGVLTVPHGGTGVATLTAGFVKTTGGAAAFTTVTTINVTTEATGVLGPTHGGLGYATFTAGYIRATGTGDFASVLPIPSADLDSTLTDKTLAGEILLPDATEDALLYVSSGGFLSGIRYVFNSTNFALTPTGSNPVIIDVSFIGVDGGGGSTVADGGTGVATFTAGFVVSPGGTSALTTVATINLASEVTGVLDVTHGGTGLSSVSTGSILYASGTTTLVTLAAEATGKVLLSGTIPSWGQVDLTTHVTGTLAVANGGTGVATFTAGIVKSSGGTTALTTSATISLTTEVAGTLPVANGGTGVATFTSGIVKSTGGTAALTTSATISLTTEVAGTLPQGNGGTGFNTYTTGDLLYASATDTLSRLAIGASNRFLKTGSPLTWAQVTLTTDVTGVLPQTNGGTGFSTYTTGDFIYASATDTLSKLSAGGATSNSILHFGSPPTWGAVVLTTQVSGTLPVANGGTDIVSYAVGDILYASGTTTLAKLADVATGNVLISGGVTTAPSWGKVALTTHISGTLPVANGGTGQTTYTDGQLLIGITSGNTLTKATLTAGTGISVTNGGGTITIASTVSAYAATEYTTAQSATYTIPSGAKFLKIIFCGAGGGGGAGNNAGSFGGGGGGGAGNCRIEDILVDGATSVGVVVGAGGNGGASAQADGAVGAATVLTINSKTITAAAGGGAGGPSASAQSGGGGGAAGSVVGGSTTSDTAGAAGANSDSADVFFNIKVAGIAGGAGVAADGVGIGGGVPSTSGRNNLYLLGGGGGGGGTANNDGAAGGYSQGTRAQSVRGFADAAGGGGGGGGSSGLAVGGNGGTLFATRAGGVGSKGSGGGGGCGGTGSTWGAGGNGGPGYIFIQPL